MLKESLDQFTAPVYGKTKRSADTYKTVATYCTQNLIRLVAEYKSVKNNQQLLREIRIDIDNYIRRYHEYCIKQRDGMLAHYHEVGANRSLCDFEHLIPESRIRDLLLAGSITVVQALNAPTVRLSRDKHIELGAAGWSSQTPDMWIPFKRYSNVFDAAFETHDGTVIDLATWTLQDHYNYFNHLVI